MRMKKFVAAIAAGGLAVGTVALSAPAQADDHKAMSLAEVLNVGNAELDHQHSDFDILAKAAETVLAAKPESPVALLADGDTTLTVFAPTDRAFMKLASALAGKKIDKEGDAFDAVAGLGVDTVETVLLYHVIPGEKIAAKDALKADGAVLPTALEGKNTKVKVSMKPTIMLRDYAPEFKNAKVILEMTDINKKKGNKQIAHGVDAVMLPFAP
jgi:uncharacterized surface protein with fasciclin (FAS1) repeats